MTKQVNSLSYQKSLFHLLEKPTCKLAASAFKYCDWMKVLAASLRVGDEWKRALRQPFHNGEIIYLYLNTSLDEFGIVQSEIRPFKG